jgi:hypothetical protein
VIPTIALAAVALSMANGGAPPARPGISVSPAHLALPAGSRATIHVRTVSGGRLLLRTSVAGLALDARGRPQVVGRRDAAAWLTVRPRTIFAARGGATFVVTSRRPSGTRPGDHTAIVLVTATTTPAGKRIAVGMRVGLVVTVRVDGRGVRRVEVVAARARAAPGGRRLIAVTVANRGDRIESIGGARLAVTLTRRGRVLGRVPIVRPRPLLPHTRAVVTFRWRPVVRGVVIARVAIVQPDGKTSARGFRLRM